MPPDRTPAPPSPPASPGAALPPPPPPPMVRHLRQVLLWPLRLVHADPGDDSEQRRAPWQLLRSLGDASPWREQVDEFTGDPEGFHERHYNEFVAFLPYVQRFLYGEGRTQRDGPESGHGPASSGDSPMRVFRRHDIAAVRVVPRAGDAAITLQVVHIDLYFFYGVDVVLLNVELAADELPLPQVQELLYRSGRAYPASWYADGRPQHSLAACEWLAADGRVLAASDAGERDAFLKHVAEHRAPRIAAHWEYVLAPLVNHHSDQPGRLRFRQIEYYRMPMMAYLALDDPRLLTRSDFIRLGLVAGAADDAGQAANQASGHGANMQGHGTTEPVTHSATHTATPPGDQPLPYAVQHLEDFEQRFCYDRFWAESGAAPKTRYLCSGYSLVVVGDARSAFYSCPYRGVLAQFRHQHFLLFLIAHFQKATLLMVSDQLAQALMALNVAQPASVKRFKRQIRMTYVAFLSFTHRYWFHEVSEQAQVKALFDMTTRHLQTDPLYARVKERIHDMNGYLDADSLRRQANTVVRLTVVTIFGLIGTVTTGFLGMNLLAEADASLSRKLWLFAATFVPIATLTFFTMVKSKRLSDFLDAVSDERLSLWDKIKAFGAVWMQDGR